jgi:AAA family ATP:ADP antiporter
MVFNTRYLLLMGLMLMMINWVNTTGEYILGSIVKEHAEAQVAAGAAPGLSEAQIIGDFYAKYFSLANGLGLLLQLFVVSRIIKHRGVPVALLILPALSFGVYNVLIFVPFLNAALAAKVLENSADYSLNNTVRNMLFLPCTYEQKFAAKQAIDSFFVRIGDVLSAALVFVGTTFIALPARGFAGINAVLAIVTLLLAWRIGRYYKTLTATTATPSAAA